MPSNIEIKARPPDFPRLRELASRLSDTPARIIHQEDVFFRTSKGRLKLRIFSPVKGELISYERVNLAGPRASHYQICPTSHPESLQHVLTAGLGVLGVVKKKRTLFLHGPTRIHLDEVEGLGNFVELEVVLGPGMTESTGHDLARKLMQQLVISDRDLVAASYLELTLSPDRAALPERKIEL